MASRGSKPKRLAPDFRRRAILDVAIRLFGQRGYSNVSAADIAREAGVTPALVHHYFGPKRNIYLTILSEWQQIAVASLKVDPRLPFRARVERTVTSWFEQIADYPAIWMATGGQGESMGDSEVAAIRDGVRSRAIEIMMRNFEDTVVDTPAARWALIGFTGYHDMVMRAFMRGDLDAETTIALLTEGLSATFKNVIPAMNRNHGGPRGRTELRGKRR